MEFLSDKEADVARLKLEEEMTLDVEDDTKEFSSYEINWKSSLKTFGEAAGFMTDCFAREEKSRLFFIAHDNDTIVGKPQLIHETIQRVPMIRKVTKIIKKGSNEEFLTQYKFINERVDKRYDGRLVLTFNMDFLVYKIVFEG